MDHEATLFRVTDLKEYLYCPRLIYYEACLPDLRPSTYKMGAGVRAHDRERQRAGRRSLGFYGLDDGEQYFDVSIKSMTLGLSGEIDEVILTKDEAIVIDYKLARRVEPHFKRQVVAYAMLLAEAWNVPVKQGMIYLIPTRQLERFNITTRLKNEVRAALTEMRRIVDEESVPPPTPKRGRCTNCKHRRFCNDV